MLPFKFRLWWALFIGSIAAAYRLHRKTMRFRSDILPGDGLNATMQLELYISTDKGGNIYSSLLPPGFFMNKKPMQVNVFVAGGGGGGGASGGVAIHKSTFGNPLTLKPGNTYRITTGLTKPQL